MEFRGWEFDSASGQNEAAIPLGFRHSGPSMAVMSEAREHRVAPPPTEVPAPSPHEILTPFRQRMSRKQTAVWIRVLLQLEREMPMALLAKELDLSDRQLGMGLSLLIRKGMARIRKTPNGLRVVLIETTGPHEHTGSALAAFEYCSLHEALGYPDSQREELTRSR